MSTNQRSATSCATETPEEVLDAPDPGSFVFYKDVKANYSCVIPIDYHMRMGAAARPESVFDKRPGTT